ncbi:MAG: cytochrome c1 [Alphaproteobacteria bacterium]|nr:cytochrome c1 [Alphaproteobacteria bacterium]
MKRSLITLLATTAIMAGAALPALAATDAQHPKHVDWAFDGPLGRVDQQSAQRGLQVYKEVCAACHGLKRIAFRNLTAIGFSEAEAKEIAKGYTVTDGPNDDGEMFTRPGILSDRFVPPFANEKAARAANGGAYPPDLSLMIKARPNGANYVYSLLTGYDEPVHEGIVAGPGQYTNPYFPGGILAMAPPLASGVVTYQDGTEATVAQMSHDVVTFLQWAAEPEMEQRKQMGIKVMVFLAIMTVFFYFAKKSIWSRLHFIKPQGQNKH